MNSLTQEVAEYVVSMTNGQIPQYSKSCRKGIREKNKGDAVANPIRNENEVQNNDRGNSIYQDQFKRALRDLKANKPPGVDLIAAELLQNLEQAEKILGT